MKATKTFDSFDKYEAWADTFENASDYQEIPAIIDDGWRVSMDLFVECKSYKTAIRRFAKAFRSSFPDVTDWAESMAESCENGYWKDRVWYDSKSAMENREISETFGTFSWGVEENMEGYWYIFLNVSGEYAGRGARK